MFVEHSLQLICAVKWYGQLCPLPCAGKAKATAMRATLYKPGKLPEDIPTEGFSIQSGSDQIVQNANRAALLLGCALALVDVLACGSGYLVYSVFDYEGQINPAAMMAVTEVSGIEFDLLNEDELLQGPVLVIVI